MKSNKLYNVIFPLWLAWWFPITWIIIIPANIIIDFLVLLLALAIVKAAEKKTIILKSLWKVVLFGFLADIIGSMLLFFLGMIDGETPFLEWFGDNVGNHLSHNPFDSVWSLLVVVFAMAVSAVLIYVFNRYVSLRNTPLTDAQKKTVSILLAVLTAPYTFLYPTEWMIR